MTARSSNRLLNRPGWFYQEFRVIWLRGCALHELSVCDDRNAGKVEAVMYLVMTYAEEIG